MAALVPEPTDALNGAEEEKEVSLRGGDNDEVVVESGRPLKPLQASIFLQGAANEAYEHRQRPTRQEAKLLEQARDR